jgi:hypothetical protein
MYRNSRDSSKEQIYIVFVKPTSVATYRSDSPRKPRLDSMMKDLELSPSSFLLIYTHHKHCTTYHLTHTNIIRNQHLRTLHRLAMTSIRIVRLPRLLSRRAFSTSTARTTSFKSGPAPPRLPKEDQEVFEKLQKQSTGAFSQPKTESSAPASDLRMKINQADSSSSAGSRMQVNQSPDSSAPEIKEGEEFHPNMRRGAKPEFEGDVNPKTGEVGGPKNDPLRWKGDWSYNGRVTDF